MTPDEIKTLFKYNAWANERLLNSLRSLDLERFTRNLNASHGSIRGTVAHLAAADGSGLSAGVAALQTGSCRRLSSKPSKWSDAGLQRLTASWGRM
jgi:hypothetical protein